MTTKTKLSTKGRVVLPREVRARHGWSAGTELWIEDRDDHVVLRAAPEPPESTLDEIAGATGYEGPRKSLEKIKAGIAEGARLIAERSLRRWRTLLVGVDADHRDISLHRAGCRRS